MSKPREEEDSAIEVDKPMLNEEQELILKGIRPEGMDYEQFRLYRKLINRHIKLYLQGTKQE